MEQGSTMTTREAILGFVQAERAKSHLLMMKFLLDVVGSMRETEFQGGKRVLLEALNWVRSEFHRVRSSAPHIQWERALQLMDRILDAVEMGDDPQAHEAVSRCISSVTTVGQRSMEALLERCLL